MTVVDFGTGGLDLAYEVMRGYDALVLVDVSRQGEPPGTLYVMEAEADDVDGQIEDGQMLDPHGMDPETVLRFVKYVGGWPGRVIVVACEPEVVEDVGIGLSESVRGAVARAADVVLETIAELSRTLRPRMHELSVATAVLNTALKHADGRRVTRVCVRVGRAAPGRAGLAALLLGDRRARHRLRGRDARADRDRRRGCAAGDCERGWSPEIPAFRCPGCGGADVAVAAGEELEVDYIEVEERGGRMHRTKVRIVEDALDANNTIARANRDDFDRHDVTVLNLMSAPGAGKTTLLERALAAPLPATAACGSACSRATCRARSTPTGWRRCTSRSCSSTPTAASAANATSTPTWSARRCPTLPLDEIDLLVIENVGNLVCPAEFRVGEDARAMVCSVTEGEDKPLKYPLMFRACELVIVNKIDLLAHLEFDLDKLLYNIDAVNPGVRDRADQRAHRGGRRRAARLAGAAGDARGRARMR